MSIAKSINLELFKLKHRYFYLTWLLLTLPVIAYMIYDMKDIGASANFIYENSNSYYFDELLKMLMLLGLTMPICAGVLISKLMDEEHKADNWKMLLTNNNSFYNLWYSKFLIVLFLMEITTLVLYFVIVFEVNYRLGYPIPFSELILSFIAVSGVNIISLTIAEYLSVYFKNQLVVLTVSLIAGFLGIIAPLMPEQIVWLIPWGYYTLCSLCRTEIAGVNSVGRIIYQIVNINPPYLLIFTVILGFLILNFILAWIKSKGEV